MTEGLRLPSSWEEVDSEPLLQAAFASAARVFPEEELDPLDWWLEEFRATRAGSHPGPYSCLILREGDGVAGGITWNFYGLPEGLVGAIGFLWIEELPGLRGRGLGRQGFETARRLMLEASQKAGKPLLFLLLEANRPDSHPGMPDSSAFWRRLGFQAAKGLDYRLPSLAFDPDTGEAALPDLALELMLRPEAEPRPRECPAVEAAVRKIYFDWYAPQRSDFGSLAAYSKALGHVSALFEDIFRKGAPTPASKLADARGRSGEGR